MRSAPLTLRSLWASGSDARASQPEVARSRRLLLAKAGLQSLRCVSSMDPVASHSCHLLQQLHEQRIQGLLCDCMLVVKGVCFKAHKNVLAAFSQYFRSLFQNSPSQKNDVFNLEIKNVGGIGQILDFMYTSHLDLNPDNVQAMLDIAQCLQVQIVLNMCHTFLRPTTAVESASATTSSAFPLLGTSIIDADCILGENPSTHSLQDSAPQKQLQTSKVLENHRLEGTHGDKLHNSLGNAQTSIRTESTELTSHHYKLRNFYSKQYKQNDSSKQDNNAGQPVQLAECAEPNPVDNHSWTARGSECVSEAADTLPPSSFGVTSNDCSADRDSGNTCLQSTKMMHLKKAVNLEKLNFLRSQKAADFLLPEPEPDEDSIRSTIATANTLPIMDNTDQTSKEKETHNPIVFNSSDQSVETERCQSISELEDHSLPPPPLERHYACNLCGKNFKHPSNLELHRRSHTGEKPFECIICGKRFTQAGNLQTHVRRHSGEKPYICEICGKRFAASGDVQRHIVIHTGEKPHLCDTCGRGFSNFSNLKEHKKTHTSDKVFTCDECGKSFNMHRKLMKHGIRHTGERPYSCSTCGKRFGGSGDLCRHLRTHTGERPYTCEACSKCFSRSAVLRRHKRMHCKTSENSPDALEEFSQVMEVSDQEGSLKSEDSLTQDISVTLLPISVQIPDDSRTEFDRNPPGSYCKMQSMIEHNNVTEQGKLSSNYIKISKTNMQQTPPSQSYGYEQVEVQSSEELLQSHSISMVRSSTVTLNNHCNDPLNNRATTMAYRNSEGPFFSSMTLWGLAMKTLHNESELDQ